MYRLAVFKILATKNVIDEVLTENIVAVNMAKIIEVSDAPLGASIKIRTSPRHEGYIYVAESKQQVLSHIGYQTYNEEITLRKSNRNTFLINLADVYYAYPKKERTKVVYFDNRMTSVSLMTTFEDFILEYNSFHRLNMQQIGCPLDDVIVWDDLRFPISAVSFGNIAPALEKSYRGGLVAEFIENGNTYVYFNAQLPHDYKEGSDIGVHLHYTISENGGGVVGGNLKWDFTYSISDMDEVFPIEETLTATRNVSTDHLHDHIITKLGVIPGGSLKISCCAICSLRRDVSVASGFKGHAWLIEADFHYQKDMLGSREEWSK